MKNVPSDTFESMVRIDSAVYARLKKFCEANKLIAAGIVSRVVAEYLEKPSKFRAGRFAPELRPKRTKK